MSRLGGFTRPFSGYLFRPQLGPRLFVITGEAVTNRSRSSPILMGRWSAQRNDSLKKAIAADRARQHHQKFKEYHKVRDRRSGSGGFSEYLVGLHHLPERRFALRFKASAATIQSLLHQGEDAP